ncbi:hypothetical protein P879_07840 [Paragonimus westermani]|uniref:Barrier-to-autointegration factor n=1 Tax=Paragonimus westermani TaxID=34504 RepID=A0A8T0DRU1_9TREM|nr:hypothetical protein P879_07840 [Paragonimus westermani]
MSTSQKLRNFVTEPIGDKVVTELPGIGLKLGERLQDKGFDKANVVLDWLKDSCGANAKQSDDCYVALKEWCASFIF